MSSPNPVADQYSSFPYPEPGDDIPTWLTSFNYDGYEPAKFSVKFWPEGRPKTDLNILVAGCGSMQAAVIAFNNPECRVTGIDFSDASIAHEERLRERHKLSNLLVRAMDLLEVSSLQQQFDLIMHRGSSSSAKSRGRLESAIVRYRAVSWCDGADAIRKIGTHRYLSVAGRVPPHAYSTDTRRRRIGSVHH